MKKIVLSLLLVLFMVTINAQSSLYKGITSGMTETQFNNYIDSNSDFSWTDSKSFVKVYIKNKLYLVSSVYNKAGKLNAILFFAMDRYEWYDYDVNVQNNAIELFNLLQVSYGDPVYDSWVSWTAIPDEDSKIVCVFTKGSVNATILAAESNDKYYIGLIVNDGKFADPEVKTSEGF